MATTVLRTATFEQWRTATNQISTDLGTVASLTTTDKSSAVNAINELKSRTIYIGTTGIVTDRSSGNQALTGISSVTLPGSTSGTVQIIPVAAAGTTVLTAPATSGTIITTGDIGTVTNTMLAGSIANSKLANSTISGVSLGSNLNALTLGDGLDGTSYNGTAGITAAVGASIARRADTQYIGTTAVTLNRASANLPLTGIASVALPGSTSGTITLQPAAIAGTTTLTLPSGTGTILSDQSAINGSQLVAGSVANAKLSSSSLTVGSTSISLGSTSTTLAGLTSVTSIAFTGALTGNASTATTLQTSRNINGVAFNGSADITIAAATPNALTAGSGIQLNSGTTFDGSAAKTISVDSSVALRADTHYIGTTGVTLNRASANLALSGISSVTLPGSTSGTVQIVPSAVAGTGTILTLPATSGTVLTTASGIDGAQLNTTSVANAKLANSSVTLGTTNVALGATATTLAGLTSVTSTGFTGALTGNVTGNVSGNAGTVTNGVYTTDTGTVTNTMLAGSIANGKLANSSITLGTTAVALGATATTLTGLTSVTSTGFTGALTGNASTATTLQTSRNINGVAFNGSADITVTANTTNALTVGTGLALDSGTAFNGSAARTLTNTGVTSLAGTANRITVSGSTGAVTLNLPQDIATTSSPTFAGETLTGAIAQNVNIADASKSNVYTLTNSNANYTANPTRFAMDSAGNVIITGNLTVSGTTTLTATTYSPDWTTVSNKQYYGQIKDGTTTAIAATNIANGDAIWFRGSNGVTIAVGSNDVTYGDNVLISLSGVPNTSLANSTITIAGTSTALGGSIALDTITGLSATGIVKRTAANTLATATAGTDYVIPSGNITGSAGSVANALTIGTGLSGGSYNGSAGVTIANTGVLALTQGGGIAITGTNANLTVTHGATSSVTSLTSAANTFITAQTYDAYGHVTARTAAAVDFTVSANYAFANIVVGADSGYTWGTINATTTQAADNSSDTITIVPGTTAGVNGIDIQGSTDAINDALRISHSKTSSLSGTYGGNGIASITVDGMGHVTAVGTATYLTSSTGVASLAGTANQVIVSGSTGAVTLSLPQSIATTSNVTFNALTTNADVIVGGNLTVNGTTTTVNSTTLDVVDLNITVGKNAVTAAASDGAGLTVGNYAGNPTLLYVNASNRWVMNRGVEGSSFVRTGGTSSQFLKADGSVDSTSYQVAGSYATATQGTKADNVGAVNGIIKSNGSATFSAAVAGTDYVIPSGSITGSAGSVANALTIGTGLSGTSYNGSSAVTISIPTSGVAAGTYNNVTVNDRGIVTAGSNVSYLTAESDTLATVTARGATTTVAITTTGFIKSGGTSSQFLKADGSVDSNTYLTSVGNGAFGVSIGVAGATNTTVTWGTSSGFTANAASASTYDLKVGPALTGLAAQMTGAGSGFLKKTAADTYSLDTSTYLTSAVTSAAAGTGISVSAATGAVTITNTGVTSLNLGVITGGGSGFTSVGSLTGSVNMQFSNPLTASLTTPNALAVDLMTQSGLTAGTYNNVTVSSKGIVTAASNVSYLTSAVTSLTGTSNQVIASASTGSVTLSLPQSINTGASVQFGSLGIGTAASGVTGEIRATDNITAYYTSDERLKTNVTKIENALEKVSQIDGVIYDWNEVYKEKHGGVDGFFVREQNSGVIAQQVEKVFPNVVGERGDGYKAVRYELLVPLLIEAIKDLKAEVEALKAQK
jgi:YD repeat-containing protein